MLRKTLLALGLFIVVSTWIYVILMIRSDRYLAEAARSFRSNGLPVSILSIYPPVPENQNAYPLLNKFWSNVSPPTGGSSNAMTLYTENKLSTGTIEFSELCKWVESQHGARNILNQALLRPQFRPPDTYSINWDGMSATSRLLLAEFTIAHLNKKTQESGKKIQNTLQYATLISQYSETAIELANGNLYIGIALECLNKINIKVLPKSISQSIYDLLLRVPSRHEILIKTAEAEALHALTFMRTLPDHGIPVTSAMMTALALMEERALICRKPYSIAEPEMKELRATAEELIKNSKAASILLAIYDFTYLVESARKTDEKLKAAVERINKLQDN